jgi:isocitrate/isopropylmalate dehydrogenase
MLRHSLGRPAEAHALDGAIHACWDEGILTRDLRPDGLGTEAVTEAVCERLLTATARSAP